MNYTINEIPDEAVELSGNEMIPIWQGETKKVSVATLAGYVQDASSYSTTETLTGGKWIDGKPIYRKVYTITPVRLQYGDSHSFVDATLDVEQLLIGSAVGYRYNNANNKVVNALNCYTDPSDKSINILNNGYDFYCVNIIIEYTKTTD